MTWKEVCVVASICLALASFFSCLFDYLTYIKYEERYREAVNYIIRYYREDIIKAVTEKVNVQIKNTKNEDMIV